MSTPSSPEKSQPRPVYSTPAKSTVEILEEMVSKPASVHSKSSSSSQSTLSSSNVRTPSTSQTSHSKPLPPHTPPNGDVTPHAFTKPLPTEPKAPPQPTSTPPAPSVATESTFSLVSHPTSSSSSSLSPPRPTSRSVPRQSTTKESRHRRHHSDPASTASSSVPDPNTNTHTHARHGRHRSSGSSRFASDSISAVMALTAERLTRETARADAAERQASEMLAMFKNAHEAKMKLERELQRTKDELGLYKVQLDNAQKEIFRAQEIVDKVDRQRVEAEEELIRMKERFRRLSRDVAVEHAMEEGRRLGFEEGLKHGRVYEAASRTASELWDDDEYEDDRMTEPQERKETKKRETKTEDDLTSRVTRQYYPKTNTEDSHESKSTRRESKPQPPSQKATTSVAPSVFPQVSTYDPKPKDKAKPANASEPPTAPSSKPEHHHHHHHRHEPQYAPATSRYTSRYGPESTPDVARYPQALPIPTVTTPTPMRVPSTQPPIPPAMPPHSHRHPSISAMDSNTSIPPESIKVKPSTDGEIHPVPVHNGNGYAHEAITVPPEGYIPYRGKNDIISMPPPHELSIPVAAEAPPVPPPKVPVVTEEAPPRPKSGGGGRPESRMRGGNNVYASSSSTRPSRNAETESVAYTTRSGKDTERTEAQRRPPSAPPRSTTPYERPFSAASARPNKGSATTQNTNANGGTERRGRREVALPIPLGDPFDDPTTANGNSLRTGSRSATPGEGMYGRPRSTTPVEAMFARPRSATPATSQGFYGRPSSTAPVPGGTPYGRPGLSVETSLEPTPERRSSNATLPGIQVETPSTRTHSAPNSNRTTMVDPILLTPESAYRPLSLPPNTALGLTTKDINVIGPDGEERIEMTLPDNNFPPGFVPLSPIPGMENLKPYPPDFSPTLPKAYTISSGAGKEKETGYSCGSPSVKPVRPRE
ncbi:hypothetical protein BDN70DRAFT_936725 [Pholiota conissans]|uniref:Uncharacterized protein n=1 Tax=Pholiota conissans TaxID=109636 RepID=A0A9P5YR76_9AGAR|nr:hypothetical protein BDN70DRAFT_936725 [Pholiota conissans]